MIRFLTIAGFFAIFGTSFTPVVSPAPDAKKKWKTLFDGKTFKGWHMYGKNYVGNCWQIDQGTLHVKPVDDRLNRGDLVTDEEYDNFDLQLEWKVSPGANSGIIFLVHEDTVQFKYSFETGPEMQVLDNIKAEDNKKENHLAGTLYDLAGKAADSQPKTVGEWNKAEIICNKGSLKLLLNDKLVVSTTLWDDSWKTMVASSKFKNWPGFASYKKGKIALQYHGNEVWYRNVRIKDLN